MQVASKAAYKLPFFFDADKLRREMEAFTQETWMESKTPRVKQETYWQVDITVPDLDNFDLNALTTFKLNPVLEDFTYLKEVLQTFECEMTRGKYSLLKAGKGFTKHRDPFSVERKEIRLHIPIITDEKFELYFDDERVQMKPGECWYLDTTKLHWGINNSETDRVHLIMDFFWNDWLEKVFEGI